MSLAVGIMHQVWGTRGEDDASVLAQVVADVTLADELGYDSVWLAEHHLARPSVPFHGRLPDPELLIARLAGASERIVLATGIKIVPLEWPMRAAERMLLLETLTGGRASFALGHGNSKELAPFGAQMVDSKCERFRDSLEQLVGYLNGASTYNGYSLAPRVPFPVASRLWVGTRDAPSIRLGARLGTNFIVGESEDALAQSQQVASYRGAGGSGEARGARLVLVAETTAEATALAEAPATLIFEAHRRQQLGGRSPASLEDLFAKVRYVVGNPEKVATELDEYVALTGVNALNVMPHAPGLPPEVIRRCMQLIAEEVVPRLSAARNDLVA